MIDIHAVMKIVNTRKGLSFQPIEAQSPYIAMYMGEYSPYGFLKIGFQSSFPYSLPSVMVIDPTTPRLHVDEEGKICIAHESSLLLNTNMPEQIVIDALQLAEQVLSLKPGTPEYAAELKKEFLSYWGKGDRGTTIWSIFSIQKSEIIQQVPLFYHNKSYILAPSLADANSFMQDHCGFPPVINKREMAWIIPLKENAAMPSPYHKYTWSDIIRYFKENADENIRKQFWELSNRPVKQSRLHLIFVAPNPTGDIAFGFAISFKNKRRLPIKASLTSMVLQLNILRFDYDFMIN